MFQEVKNSKVHENINFDTFDDMCIEASAKNRKEEFSSEAIGKNGVKIVSRIRAIKRLSELRIHNIENDLIGATGKEEEKLRKAITRKRKKVEEKVSVLEEKLNFV